MGYLPYQLVSRISSINRNIQLSSAKHQRLNLQSHPWFPWFPFFVCAGETYSFTDQPFSARFRHLLSTHDLPYSTKFMTLKAGFEDIHPTTRYRNFHDLGCRKTPKLTRFLVSRKVPQKPDLELREVVLFNLPES